MPGRHITAGHHRDDDDDAHLTDVILTTVSRLMDNPEHHPRSTPSTPAARAPKLNVRDVAHRTGIALELDEADTPPTRKQLS